MLPAVGSFSRETQLPCWQESVHTPLFNNYAELKGLNEAVVGNIVGLLKGVKELAGERVEVSEGKFFHLSRLSLELTHYLNAIRFYTVDAVSDPEELSEGVKGLKKALDPTALRAVVAVGEERLCSQRLFFDTFQRAFDFLRKWKEDFEKNLNYFNANARLSMLRSSSFTRDGTVGGAPLSEKEREAIFLECEQIGESLRELLFSIDELLNDEMVVRYCSFLQEREIEELAEEKGWNSERIVACYRAHFANRGIDVVTRFIQSLYVPRGLNDWKMVPERGKYIIFLLWLDERFRQLPNRAALLRDSARTFGEEGVALLFERHYQSNCYGILSTYFAGNKNILVRSFNYRGRLYELEPFKEDPAGMSSTLLSLQLYKIMRGFCREAKNLALAQLWSVEIAFSHYHSDTTEELKKYLSSPSVRLYFERAREFSFISFMEPTLGDITSGERSLLLPIISSIYGEVGKERGCFVDFPLLVEKWRYLWMKRLIREDNSYSPIKRITYGEERVKKLSSRKIGEIDGERSSHVTLEIDSVEEVESCGRELVAVVGGHRKLKECQFPYEPSQKRWISRLQLPGLYSENRSGEEEEKRFHSITRPKGCRGEDEEYLLYKSVERVRVKERVFLKGSLLVEFQEPCNFAHLYRRDIKGKKKRYWLLPVERLVADIKRGYIDIGQNFSCDEAEALFSLGEAADGVECIVERVEKRVDHKLDCILAKAASDEEKREQLAAIANSYKRGCLQYGDSERSIELLGFDSDKKGHLFGQECALPSWLLDKEQFSIVLTGGEWRAKKLYMNRLKSGWPHSDWMGRSYDYSFIVDCRTLDIDSCRDSSLVEIIASGNFSYLLEEERESDYHLQKEYIKSLLHGKGGRRRVLLAVDGIDELPKNSHCRKSILRELRKFAKGRHVDLIVAKERMRGLGSHFSSLEVAGFSDSAIRENSVKFYDDLRRKMEVDFGQSFVDSSVSSRLERLGSNVLLLEACRSPLILQLLNKNFQFMTALLKRKEQLSEGEFVKPLVYRELHRYILSTEAYINGVLRGGIYGDEIIEKRCEDEIFFLEHFAFTIFVKGVTAARVAPSVCYARKLLGRDIAIKLHHLSLLEKGVFSTVAERNKERYSAPIYRFSDGLFTDFFTAQFFSKCKRVDEKRSMPSHSFEKAIKSILKGKEQDGDCYKTLDDYLEVGLKNHPRGERVRRLMVDPFVSLQH